MRTLADLLARTAPFALTQAASRGRSDETFLLGSAHEGVLVEAITPVIGGNVESFDPGVLDVVRVPSIRGAVRWWWRALQPELSTDDLRAKEREVWGGVGRDANEPAAASRVRISVNATKPGEVKPAGKHLQRPGGEPKSLPDWDAGKEVGYGLFPLQCSRDERRAWGLPGNMPTKSYRVDLEFKLRVSTLARGGSTLTESDQRLVLDAFRLWLTFGGYGARTRRGFGALHTAEVSYDDVIRALERVKGAALPNRPTLAQHALYEGPAKSTALDAHVEVLRVLQEFRQGTDFGRKLGQDKTYGRSRWPEADSLRVLSHGHFRKHPPTGSLKQPSAPRAEFGLPIGVRFIPGEDSTADGEITSSKEGGRWASPLLIRPVQRGNDFVPVALVLQGHVPGRAWMKTNNNGKSHEAPVAYDETRTGGAHEHVRDALIRTRGHALEAFAQWLVEKRGFQKRGGAR